MSDLRAHIRDIPDFPKPGIRFKDITPLLLDAEALAGAVDALAAWSRPREIDLVVAAEARGFILGGALARQLGVGFVPARKPGKLPHETVTAEYLLEYGVDALEMHADALSSGARVLVHDDLLATGGTARALCDLVEDRGGHVVGCAFLVELAFLDGRARLAPFDVHTLVTYDGQAPVVVRRSRLVRAPVEAVWPLVADAHHLPRWWPRTIRVEDVAPGGWTSVLATDRGRSVRADFRVLASEPGTVRRWAQELDGTPFAALLREAVTEVRLGPEGAGSRVTVELSQHPRGWARLGGLMLRRAARRQLDEALGALAGLVEG